MQLSAYMSLTAISLLLFDQDENMVVIDILIAHQQFDCRVSGGRQKVGVAAWSLIVAPASTVISIQPNTWRASKQTADRATRNAFKFLSPRVINKFFCKSSSTSWNSRWSADATWSWRGSRAENAPQNPRIGTQTSHRPRSFMFSSQQTTWRAFVVLLLTDGLQVREWLPFARPVVTSCSVRRLLYASTNCYNCN